MEAQADGAAHVVEGAQLVVVTPDHHVVEVCDAAGEVVARVGGLSSMANQLRNISSRREQAPVAGDRNTDMVKTALAIESYSNAGAVRASRGPGLY